MGYQKKFKNKLALLLLLSCLIYANGCWDAKDLANLAIVSAVAVDLDEKQPGQVLITIQIIKPGEVKSGAGSSESESGKPATGQRPPYLMVSSSGKTVAEAFRNFAGQINRELYLSHNQFIVISKDVAQKGMLPVLDYFIRTRQTRETNWVLISDGKASDIIATSSGLEKIPANEITRLIINHDLASQASAITLDEFARKSLSKASSICASLVRLSDASGKKEIQLTGAAVIKAGKFIGELDQTETRGLLWVTNKVKRGNITVTSSRGDFNLGILRAAGKLVPEVRHGKVTMKLIINVEYGLTGETEQADFTDPQPARLMETLVRQTIRREINAAFAAAFHLDADVFGLGELIHQQFPTEWKLLQPVWDRQFLNTGIGIKVNTRLKTVGLLIKPLVPK